MTRPSVRWLVRWFLTLLSKCMKLHRFCGPLLRAVLKASRDDLTVDLSAFRSSRGRVFHRMILSQSQRLFNLRVNPLSVLYSASPTVLPSTHLFIRPLDRRKHITYLALLSFHFQIAIS